MSFDAHSLERLAALGRTLPSKLPPPEPAATAPPPRAQERRHRVETEQDPGRLFHELMDASSDGSVPPHLVERLRGLERRPAAEIAPAAGSSRPGQRRSRGRRSGASDPEADLRDELYTAFGQLLLEEEDEG